MTWTCPCGWDPDTVVPWFSADWYAAHRDAHLTAFPNLDSRSKANLTMFVVMATDREAKAS